MSFLSAAEWKDEFHHYLRMIFWRLPLYLCTNNSWVCGYWVEEIYWINLLF